MFRKEMALGLLLVFLSCSFPAMAQEDAFTVDTPGITNDLRVPYVYQEKITIHSVKEQSIKAEIVCGDDISCQWASFAFAGGRANSLDLPFSENESYPLFVEVVVPNGVNMTQYEFSVLLSNSYSNIEIPYIFRVGFSPSIIDGGILWLSDTCSGSFYEFPNSWFPAVTCSGLAIIFIVLGIIIIAVKMIRSKG